jgi:hypothetical protein
MSSLSAFLMRNKLDALGEKPEYTTADVNSLMPQQPSWSSPLAGLGSYQLSQEAGAEPNWFGRNVLSNIPPEAMHAANFLIPGKVPRIQNPIKAYHGSPHDFDKFDLSKIGTGEGAQAYGHGLYFAENEGVARGYRDALGKQNYAGKPAKDSWETSALEYIDKKVLREQGPEAALSQAVKKLEDQSEFYRKAYANGDPSPNLYDTAIERLKRLDPSKIEPPGRMYEVALHATPEQFLDWDKPLSGQPAPVRAALDQAHTAATEGTSKAPWRFLRAAQQAKPEATVQDYLKLHYGDEAAAKAFNQAGIPGIRYLDQGSRGAGSGTSNYVVWSPELIEILRKYAAPPAIAAPALASILQDQQSQ